LQNSNRIFQSLGIPYTALLSVVFGLLLASFPIGIFVVFDSDIGDDINFDYPITHLTLFDGTDLYQSDIGVSIGMSLLFYGFFMLYCL